MVIGVVVGAWRLASGDDAPRASMAQTGRGHGVFAVVAMRGPGQVALAVAEHAIVLRMRIRPAALDQGKRVQRFGWQQ